MGVGWGANKFEVSQGAAAEAALLGPPSRPLNLLNPRLWGASGAGARAVGAGGNRLRESLGRGHRRQWLNQARRTELNRTEPDRR